MVDVYFHYYYSFICLVWRYFHITHSFFVVVLLLPCLLCFHLLCLVLFLTMLRKVRYYCYSKTNCTERVPYCVHSVYLTCTSHVPHMYITYTHRLTRWSSQRRARRRRFLRQPARPPAPSKQSRTPQSNLIIQGNVPWPGEEKTCKLLFFVPQRPGRLWPSGLRSVHHNQSCPPSGDRVTTSTLPPSARIYIPLSHVETALSPL